MLVMSIVDDSSDFARIFLIVLFLCESNGLVTQDIFRIIKYVCAINNIRPFYPIKNLPILVLNKRTDRIYDKGTAVIKPSQGKLYGPTIAEISVL